MPKHNPARYTPYHERITQRAHDLWEASGRPEGCAVEHWLRAERELEAESRGQTAQPTQAPGQPGGTQR